MILSKQAIEEIKKKTESSPFHGIDELFFDIDALINSHEELRVLCNNYRMYEVYADRCVNLKKELGEAKKQIKYLESKIVRKASCCEENERELKEAKAELEKLREEKRIRETAMKDSNF